MGINKEFYRIGWRYAGNLWWVGWKWMKSLMGINEEFDGNKLRVWCERITTLVGINEWCAGNKWIAMRLNEEYMANW